MAVEIDLNKIEETSEIYDPTTQVVRSEQTSEETNESKSSSNSGITGTASNLDINSNSNVKSGGPSDSQARSQSTINYEISKTVRHSVKNVGEILKLSVAVVLEGSYTQQEGKREYVPLTENQLSKITSLVKSAIGFNDSRGDIVEVVDLPFSEIEQIKEKRTSNIF